MIIILKGIRGATTVEQNTKEEILDKTKELLLQLIAKNNIEKEKVASVFFTATADVNADFPAVAARSIGWVEVPLICAKEIDVPNSLKSCIRILIHYNVEPNTEIKHIYLRGAKALRPDIK